MGKIDLSIIIPTKNEEKYLPELLRSIRSQREKAYEIIVADANSQDNTIKVANDFGCLVVKGGYPAEARNNGVKYSSGKILAFIDADVQFPHPGFLEKCLKEFSERKLDVAGTYHKAIPANTHEKRLFDRIFFGIDNLGLRMAENSKIPKMHIGMFAIKETHEKINGFREDLEFAEDADYSKRAFENGARFGILKTPGALLVSPRRLERKRLKMVLKYAALNFWVWLGKEYKRDGKVKYF